MNWKNLFKRQVKASAAAPLMVQWGAHQPRFTPRQYDRLADEGYRKNVIAYRCIKLVSQTAASVPFVVTQKGQRVESHPLLTLLRRPNPGQGGASLFESLYSFILIAGNAYLEGVGPSARPPRELWTLRPDRMKVIPGAQGLPEAYRYTVDGRAHDFAADPLTGRARVLHVRSFHPLDDWYGLSPLEAAAVSVDQHNDAATWNAALLQTGGRPSGALVYKPAHADAPDTLTDQQRQSLKDEMERYFTGADNAGRPLVLEGGLDWKEMSLSPKDMDWLAGKDVSAREIALAFHVPAQLVGIAGSQTYANFEQARLALFDDAVLPLLIHVRDALNNWLAPQFGEDLAIDYDLDKVEALSLRRAETWARIATADFLTVDEKRLALGFPPAPAAPVEKEESGQRAENFKYSPSQPRHPSGSSAGGQWSGGGSGGGGARVLNVSAPKKPGDTETLLEGGGFVVGGGMGRGRGVSENLSADKIPSHVMEKLKQTRQLPKGVTETGSSIEKLTDGQKGSLKKLKGKGGGDYKTPTVTNLSDGSAVYTVKVPGNVPGSYRIYDKHVSSSGELIKMNGVTIDPEGNVVHVKPK